MEKNSRRKHEESRCEINGARGIRRRKKLGGCADITWERKEMYVTDFSPRLCKTLINTLDVLDITVFSPQFHPNWSKLHLQKCQKHKLLLVSHGCDKSTLWSDK